MKEFNSDAVKMLNRITAKEIDQKMRKQRLSASENDKRRWIWELIQNAKDKAAVDFPSKKVSIQVSVKENVLEFSHNYGYFTKANITGLIRQISSDEKDRDDIKKTEQPKTTGRFGTGFMTTHLLSPIVKISGIYKKEDDTFYNISFTLNRDYNKISELEKNIDNAFIEAEKSLEKLEYRNIDFSNKNTRFQYSINNSSSQKILQKGIRDLEKSLYYSLIFVDSISDISIIEDDYEQKIRKKESKKLTNEISLTTIEIKDIFVEIEGISVETSEEKFVCLKNDLTRLTIKVIDIDNVFKVLPFKKNTPKLFLDFPLIGTENFGLPFIINNSFFEPTEPRDGVFLTTENENEVNHNKKIITDGVQLYFTLLDYASSNNWQDVYLLAMVSQQLNFEWLSNIWYKELTNKIFTKLTSTPLIDLTGGERVAIKNLDVLFPSHSQQVIREKIWDLTYQILPSDLPIKEDIHKWHSVLWKNCFKLTLLDITKRINRLKSLTKLSEKYFAKNNDKSIAWLNQYYDLLNLEGNTIKHIIQDEFSVLPAQDGKFYVRAKLSFDKKIEEDLKEVIKNLGQDWRTKLRRNDLITHNKYDSNSKNQIKHTALRQEDIINKINNLIGSNSITTQQQTKAVLYLTSCFPKQNNSKRETIYNFAKSIFKENISAKKILTNSNDAIWEKSDKIIIRSITEQIAEKKNIDTLEKNIDIFDSLNIYDWLEKYIQFLLEEGRDNILNTEKYALLPNQNGVFKIKDELSLDNGEIDEELKDICRDLGYDFRDKLFVKEIFLEMPESRTKSNKDIGIKIDELVNEKLNSEQSEETKQVFNQLYLWLNNNKELAKNILTSLYSRKHRLRNDEDIAEDMQKAIELDKLMTKFDVSNVNELENLVTRGLSVREAEEKETISIETLVSLGITTEKDLETLMLNNQIFANKFKHTSVTDFHWYKAVHNKIERAKKNVINYLNDLNDYDCQDPEELSTTVIGGVTKNKRDVKIVIRPSDSGEIIFYYGAEKDYLEEPDTELWVEDGHSKPELITLGRILKDNSINKIQIQ